MKYIQEKPKNDQYSDLLDLPFILSLIALQ